MTPRKASPDRDFVAHVEKTLTTHAAGMEGLVGLALGVRQGEPLDEMRVDFELNCGDACLVVNGGTFEVSLRCCFVVLEMGNCEVRPQTKYEHHLASGSIEAASTETRESSRGSEAGIGADASGQASPGGLLPRLGIWGKASRNGRSSSTVKETVKRQSRIALIKTSGQDRWRVGDPKLGDVRNGDGRLFGSYFGEEHEGGDPKPLCFAAALDPKAASSMTASAVVRLGHLWVCLGDDVATTDQLDDVREEVKGRGHRAEAGHRAAAAELRARMAGLALAKAMHAAQRKGGLRLADGEVLLARQTIMAASKRPEKAE